MSSSSAEVRKDKILGHISSKTDGNNDQSLTVVDNRNGKKYTLPITHNTINGNNLFSIKHNGTGIRNFDPGYLNTVAAKSRICFIDGGKGILRYRGYPIEQLAVKSTFMESAFLLLNGELPTQSELSTFNSQVMDNVQIHEDIKRMVSVFRHDAHPMAMMASIVAALGTLHPEANPAIAGQKVYNNISLRRQQMMRAIGQMSTIAAAVHRHRQGQPFIAPNAELGYVENFLTMLNLPNKQGYKPHPKLVRALDVLFTLHADHELNCSTAAMRHLCSSGVDVYSCLSGSICALYGPKHGGANEAVINMLEDIGSVENVPAFIEGVKSKTRLLMGFGHRVYKNYDPRAKIVRMIADDVFEVLGKEPLIEIAVALEKIALSDPYFVDRKLYPNVDFYSGLIYKALGFPHDFFTVLFAIPRTVGWLAHWNEFLDDKDNKIVRPYQMYLGEDVREYDQGKRGGSAVNM